MDRYNGPTHPREEIHDRYEVDSTICTPWLNQQCGMQCFMKNADLDQTMSKYEDPDPEIKNLRMRILRRRKNEDPIGRL